MEHKIRFSEENLNWKSPRLSELLKDRRYEQLLAKMNIDMNAVASYASLKSLTTSADGDEPFPLPHIMNALINSVLEDAIDQFYILGTGTGASTDIRSLAERMETMNLTDPVYDYETAEPFHIAFERQKHMKIFEDCGRVTKMLISIKNELKFDNAYNILKIQVDEFRKKKQEKIDLICEEGKNFSTMNSLKASLLSQYKDSEKQIQELNEHIATLNDEIENVSFENKLKRRYLDRWQTSRSEQNDLNCYEQEEELRTIIETYKTETESEIRINNEIELYITENEKDIKEGIEKWKVRYDKDMEARELDIQLLKEKREDLQNDYIALTKEFESRQKQIEDYLEYREKKRKEMEELEMMTENAIKIQAWWRGVMVRRKLGPFRVKKSRKGKGKLKGDKAKGKGDKAKGKGKKK